MGAVRSLADDRNIVIKKADKASCVVVWYRSDYVMEAQKQLNDTKVYKNISDSKDLSPKLTEKSNKIFKSLKGRGFIIEKQLKYFCFDFKIAWNLGKLYRLQKIHKRMFNIPGRLVIFNCGTPIEKFSEFLNIHLQPVIRKGLPYIEDYGDFINKLKRIGSVPENAILVTSDVVGFSPNISHDVVLKGLKQALDKREPKKVRTEYLLNMVEFVLKNNFFEFNGNIKQQISRTALSTMCAPTYSCIFMDEVNWPLYKRKIINNFYGSDI